MNQPQPSDLPKGWRANPWIQECLSRMERFSNDPLKVEEYEKRKRRFLFIRQFRVETSCRCCRRYGDWSEARYGTRNEEGKTGNRARNQARCEQGIKQGVEQRIKQGVEQDKARS